MTGTHTTRRTSDAAAPQTSRSAAGATTLRNPNAVIDPDAAEILRIYHQANGLAKEAVEKEQRATWLAAICGQRLIEKRAQLQAKGGSWQGAAKADRNKFTVWLEEQCPEIAQRTAYRWMDLAEKVAAKFQLPTIDIDGAPTLSRLLEMPASELPEAAKEWRQTMFDFCAENSIRRIVNDETVDDTAFKRALNGKTSGGTHAQDDRKDFPKFIKEHLSDITTLLGGREKDREKRWGKMNAGQRQAVLDAVATSIARWPTACVEQVAELFKKEIKTR